MAVGTGPPPQHQHTYRGTYLIKCIHPLAPLINCLATWRSAFSSFNQPQQPQLLGGSAESRTSRQGEITRCLIASAVPCVWKQGYVRISFFLSRHSGPHSPFQPAILGNATPNFVSHWTRPGSGLDRPLLQSLATAAGRPLLASMRQVSTPLGNERRKMRLSAPLAYGPSTPCTTTAVPCLPSVWCLEALDIEHSQAQKWLSRYRASSLPACPQPSSGFSAPPGSVCDATQTLLIVRPCLEMPTYALRSPRPSRDASSSLRSISIRT